MTNDYALATLKIDRAKKHISELCEAIDSFAARKPYRFVEDRESEPGQLLLRVHAAEAIPNEFPLMLGDGIHNLRFCRVKRRPSESKGAQSRLW
jgi:hypothetical protein